MFISNEKVGGRYGSIRSCAPRCFDISLSICPITFPVPRQWMTSRTTCQSCRNGSSSQTANTSRSGNCERPARRIVKMFAPSDFLDLEHTAHPKLFEKQHYVWDALKQIASYLQFRLKPAVFAELTGKPFISNRVFVGRGPVVEQGAVR